MGNSLASLTKDLDPDWLLGSNNPKLLEQIQQYQQALRAIDPRVPRRVLIRTTDPIEFLAGFLAAYSTGFSTFFTNPGWGSQEWDHVFQQIPAGVIQAGHTYRLYGDPSLSSEPMPTDDPWILIPTGGSSGRVRFTIHTWSTLSASVHGFLQHFQIDQANFLCVLPLYHVSGFMPFLRCFLSRGQLQIIPWKQLEAGDPSTVDPRSTFLSLVPTQLKRLLDRPDWIPWLRSFEAILLGGAPAWPDLLTSARSLGIPLAPTYGMTETGSQICTLKPETFLAGNSSCGSVLPHAQIRILDDADQPLPPQQTGIIGITAASLALGYWTGSSTECWSPGSEFRPGDLGWWDPSGYLHVVGRQDHVILTGGENVWPAEVEAAIRATDWVQDVCVVGIPDPEWGQIVVAAIVPKDPQGLEPRDRSAQLQAHLRDQLSPHKQPKHWIQLDQIPRNDQGKINRSQIRHNLESLLQSQL